MSSAPLTSQLPRGSCTDRFINGRWVRSVQQRWQAAAGLVMRRLRLDSVYPSGANSATGSPFSAALLTVPPPAIADMIDGPFALASVGV